MSETSGDAPATGMSVDQAAGAFEALLTQREKGDSKGGKALKDEQSFEPEEEADEDPPEDDADGAGEGETDEDEADGESEDDEVDEGSDEKQPPKKFRVKVDGEELEVTQDELVAGYQREQDYSRKTMALAEARRAQDAEFQGVREERERYKTLLPQLQNFLEQQYASPELEELRQTDPGEWAARTQEIRDRHAATVAETQRLQEAADKEANEAKAISRDTEVRALVRALPEIADPKVSKELVTYARAAGYTPDELDNSIDHRAWVLAYKAMQFDKLKAKAPKPDAIKPVIKAVAPGNAGQPQRSKVTELTRSKQRLAKTGTVRDAAAVFERMLSD